MGSFMCSYLVNRYMQILLLAEFDPTDSDVQLLNSSTNFPNFDLLPQSIDLFEGDMLI
jgi:hypothetical protein